MIKTKTRGCNKTFYHYKVYDQETNDNTYYYTLDEISNVYNICRATLNYMVKNPDKKNKKNPNITISNFYKHHLCIDYNIPEHALD